MPTKPTIEVVCPTCGQTRQLAPRDARRTKQCRQCHLRSIAPLGYAAMVTKYGEKWAVRHVQVWRQNNPSSLEQLVANELDKLNIHYTREVMITTTTRKSWLVDFVVGTIAIEVNGSYVHGHHQMRDRRKLKYMRRKFREVVVLDEDNIRHPAFPGRLRAVMHSLFVRVSSVEDWSDEYEPAASF